MASKRGNGDKDHQVSGKRRFTIPNSEHGEASISMNDKPWLLEIVRNAIREEVRPIIKEELEILLRHLRPCCGLALNPRTGTSGGRVLQLCFMNTLPPTIFTHYNITAKGGDPLQIELRDARYQHRMVEEGSFELKIQICVLDGDFISNGIDDWTTEQFNANTLSPRDGKGPLLRVDGDTIFYITLTNGVGHINKKISFGDNSSWTRTKMFRLGLKVVQSTSTGAAIREGISEPFRVLDNRGAEYEKHDCPSLNDEVWRLKKIRKTGPIHKQLSSKGIKTVKHVLQSYTTNQASLREKIGKISRTAWDTIIDHAKACHIDDDERYIYASAEQSIDLILNCIFEVVVVSFKGQIRSPESLNSEEERLVERVKQEAYNNLENLKPLETTPDGSVNSLSGVQAGQYGAPDQGLQQLNFPIPQQGQPETWPNMCQPCTSTSHLYEVAYSDNIGANQLPALGETQLNGEQSMYGAYIDGNEWLVSGSHTNQYANCLSPTPRGQDYAFNHPYDNGAEFSNHSFFPNPSVGMSGNGKPKKVWHKIRATLKWVIPHLRVAKIRKSYPRFY